MIIRYIHQAVQDDLKKKMVFVCGPRQSGKTTLAQMLLTSVHIEERYFNWDYEPHKEMILKNIIPAKKGLVVFDEIHKYYRFRNWLKGLYDTRKNTLSILVTGSARLDFYNKGGDSLQGRYNMYRLHPLSLKELSNEKNALNNLLEKSGFPEPYFNSSPEDVRKWSRQYRSRLINEDLLSLERINDVSKIEALVSRLPECVGSPLSLNSLREDLSVAHESVARWLQCLENLYAIFRIYPFGSSKLRSLKKEAKHYHYDWTVVHDHGAKLENLVACHLLKWCHFIEDTQGYTMDLKYFRDRERREVDFVLLKQNKPIYFVEVKTSQKPSSKDLIYLKNKFPDVEAYQISLEINKDHIDRHGIRQCHVETFLNQFI